MALDQRITPQAGSHDAGEISPTSLDTYGALSPHEPQAELPGIRATIALAQTLEAQGIDEPVHHFNQRQKAYVRKRAKRLTSDTNVIGLCMASTHPVVRAYGRKMGICADGGIQVMETQTGARLLRRIGTRCNRSHCAECRHTNNQVFIKGITPEVERALGDGTRLRFAVLTLPNCPNAPEALGAAILAGQMAMTKLRRQKWFKAATFGTIETFEYTINAETGELNPHLNVLIAGPGDSSGYVDQERLSDEWRKLTGAYIVHIQEALQGAKMNVANVRTALNEALKYITKGMDMETVQDVETLILGTQGKRLRRTTGIFYGLDVDATDQEQDEAETEEQTSDSVVSKEEAREAVTLAIVPLTEIELLYSILDAEVRLAPAFHYAATGSLPITALATPRPPGYH